MTTGRHWSDRSLLRREFVPLGLAALSVFVVLRWIDLSPQVESDFFFAKEDPQLQASVEIQRRFPSPPQIIIRAEAADLQSDTYVSAVRALTAELEDVSGVTAVHSITTDNARSPLWGPLLLTPDGRATNVVVQTDRTVPEELVPRIEAVVNRRSEPDFDLRASGVPYVLELIRRNLFRDLVVFSSAAFVLFGVMVGAIYRNWRIVLGTLATCVTACAVTVSLAHILGIAIGLLTANIATIVFVLTLSHMVFLTSNWQRSRLEPTTRIDPVGEAVRVTIWPSFWCMFTTLCGFLSLLLASARPLRELGFAGAIGTVTALGIAYGMYPPLLRAVPPAAATSRNRGRMGQIGALLPTQRAAPWLFALGVLVGVAALGVRRLNTDPGLLSYFAEGSELRNGLEAIDRDGGSSSLNLMVRDADGGRIDTDSVYDKLWSLQAALQGDTAVGVVLSPAVVLAEAKRAPLAGFLSLPRLMDILESPLLGRIGSSFVTPDRDQGLFYLRMREAGRREPRATVIARIEQHARASGLDVALLGGQYDLQAQLGRLIASSLRIGLGGLLVLFVGVAYVVSRSGRVTIAMVACLTAIPILVLGTMGHLGMAIDIIASPAANVALAMGVDSMIHLVVRARRVRNTGSGVWEALLSARAELWRPVLGATLIICAGFGIFGLSTFPPTQRFGLAVILGTLTAATMTLVALPFAAGRVGARAATDG